ncbi:hypothetical protein V6N12_062185 [Hibiscus sabdariffa]|uniref:Uncharacterized protein n=1 Tax=Hibiscus sabdariffa TaxID=183260 RepID=A0ABR2F841_9ROSI
MWAADGLRVLALNIPLCSCFAQLVLDCIKVFVFENVNQSIYARAVVGHVQNTVDGDEVDRHFPASYSDVVVASSIIGVKFHYPVQIGTGLLSCKAEPTKIMQPFVDDRFEAIIFQAVVEEEPLFFPFVFGSNHGIAFSDCCVVESGWHAFGGGR